MKTLKKVVTMVAIFIAVLTITNMSKAATVRVTGDTLNVRESASTSSNVIAMLSKGVECELLGEEGDFYQIRYQDYTGYVSKQYSEIVGDNNNADNSQNTNNEISDVDGSEDTTNGSENNVNEENIVNEAGETNEGNISVEKTLANNTDIKILPLIYASVLENSKEAMNVLVITEINGWSYIQTDEINGWVRSDRLSSGETSTSQNNSTQKEDEPQETTENNENYTERTGYINEDLVNVRSGPSTNDSVVKVLTLNSEVTITGEDGDWYRVKSGEDTGYISKEFVSDTKKETVSRSASARTNNSYNFVEEIEDSEEKEESKKESEKVENESNSNTTKGEDVVIYAKQYLGYPYVYGAAGSSSFDCSGFTMYVYNHFGISLPHGATSQSKYGTKVNKSDLQAGDIVFLTDYETGIGIGHCGIYVGSGNFIHASTTGYKVKISSLDGEYAGRFYSAIRLL